MPRGKKYTDEIKEKAFALYASTGNINEVARELNVPRSTVKGWIDAKPKDAVDKVREENKIACARIAGRTAEKLLKLLEHRADTALKNEEAIETLISEIYKSPSDEVPDSVKKNVVDKLRKIQVQSIKDIAIAMGTAYDKYMIMTESIGEKDESETGVIVLPEIKIEENKMSGN